MSLLGDIGNDSYTSHILSHNEMARREGMNSQKGMNIRYDGRPSVFLISTASHAEAWEAQRNLLIYDGHDATTAGAAKWSIDQPMYKEEGILSDNGKFYKEAMAAKDGKREVMQIQVYEWLAAGVWYDKGLFELVDATYLDQDGRKVFKFFLKPIGDLTDTYGIERMISNLDKQDAYERNNGACALCGATLGLRFISSLSGCQLLCSVHTSSAIQGFL